ncbi:unnamed protein product [Arctogadus glacialis]
MLRKGFKASSFTLESIHLRAIHPPLKAIHYDTFTEVLLETRESARESATDYNLRRTPFARMDRQQGHSSLLLHYSSALSQNSLYLRGTAGGSPPTLSSAQQACITARGTAGGPYSQGFFGDSQLETFWNIRSKTPDNLLIKESLRSG